MTEGQRNEADGPGLSVLEDVHGDSEALLPCARNAESVPAVCGADRVAVPVVWVANDPCRPAASEESLAAGVIRTSVRHREGDAKTVGGPTAVTEASFQRSASAVDVPGQR